VYHSKFLKAEILETEEMAVNNNYDQQLTVPFTFSSTWISWTFLMAYLKRSGKAMVMNHLLVLGHLD
jgi:hypothetical protein